MVLHTTRGYHATVPWYSSTMVKSTVPKYDGIPYHPIVPWYWYHGTMASWYLPWYWNTVVFQSYFIPLKGTMVLYHGTLGWYEIPWYSSKLVKSAYQNTMVPWYEIPWYSSKLVKSAYQNTMVFHTTLRYHGTVPWYIWVVGSTLCLKKTSHFYFFCDNFSKCWPMLIILSLIHSWMNGRWSWIKLCRLTSKLLPPYLAKSECASVKLFL